jgi:transcriptional regulator with XRE-family HTH domain
MKFEFDRDKLRRGLMARGLTLSELSRLARVSPSTVTSALAGKSVNMITAVRIANALKAHPARPELEDFLPDLEAQAQR